MSHAPYFESLGCLKLCNDVTYMCIVLVHCFGFKLAKVLRRPTLLIFFNFWALFKQAPISKEVLGRVIDGRVDEDFTSAIYIAPLQGALLGSENAQQLFGRWRRPLHHPVSQLKTDSFLSSSCLLYYVRDTVAVVRSLTETVFCLFHLSKRDFSLPTSVKCTFHLM